MEAADVHFNGSIGTNDADGSRRRCCYSRSELENLRFCDVEEQRRRWDGIMQGIDSVVVQEYDGLSSSNQQKNASRSDGKQKNLKEKELVVTGETLLGGNVKGLYLLDSYEELCVNNFVDGEDLTVCNGLCDEDEDSDDEYESIQRVAFVVEGEPDFDSGPPQDGFEYLRRVRWEAAHIPNVKVAKLNKSKGSEQTPYMPRIPDVPKCPDNLLPLKNWEDNFLADFSELRQAFSQVDMSKDEQLTVLPGKASRNVKPDQELPTLGAIRTLDPVSRAALLRKLIDQFESATKLSRDNCLWMFALCATVDNPLDADMSAAMRCLLRKCSGLLAMKSERDDEVVMLTVLVVIAGKYFRQSEL